MLMHNILLKFVVFLLSYCNNSLPLIKKSWQMLTFWNASSKSPSILAGLRSSSITEVSFSKGTTLNKIIDAMKSEQIGSAIFQPKFSIKSDDTITPQLPNVSANTWRNTPTGNRMNDAYKRVLKFKLIYFLTNLVSCVITSCLLSSSLFVHQNQGLVLKDSTDIMSADLNVTGHVN